MSQKINLLIPVEIFVRDFESRLYLGSNLKNDFNVFLGEQQELLRNIYRFRPGIYFDKSISINKAALYKRLKKLGWSIVALDSEGLSFHTNKHKYVSQRVNKTTLEIVDMFFCWSKEEYQSLVNLYPQYIDKFRVTGSYRIDYLKYQGINQKRKIDGPILISSSLIKYHKLGEKGLYKLFQKLGRFKDEYSIIEYKKKRKMSIKGHEKFHESLKRIIDNNPEETFIIRSHPAENPIVWLELSKTRKNVIFQPPNLPIHDNFSKVKGLIHCGCTSAFEATAYGLPTFYLNVEKSYERISKSISKEIYEDFNFNRCKSETNIQSIEEYSQSNAVNSINKELIELIKKPKLRNHILSFVYLIYKVLTKNKHENEKYPIKSDNELRDFISKRQWIDLSQIQILKNGKLVKIN